MKARAYESEKMLLSTRAPELSVLSNTASDQKGLTPPGITCEDTCPMVPLPVRAEAAGARETAMGKPCAKTDFVCDTKCAENGAACILANPPLLR